MSQEARSAANTDPSEMDYYSGDPRHDAQVDEQLDARSAAYVNEHGVWIDGSYLIEKYQYATDRQTTGVQWLVYTVKDGELVYLRPFKTRRAAAEFIGGKRG